MPIFFTEEIKTQHNLPKVMRLENNGALLDSKICVISSTVSVRSEWVQVEASSNTGTRVMIYSLMKDFGLY